LISGQYIIQKQDKGGAEAPDLKAALEHGLPVGRRNDEMYRLACSLFRKMGTTPEASVEVKENLMGIWSASDRTGMTPAELLQVTDSARRFVRRMEAQDAATMAKYIESFER
jgi:hypothetical protein